MEFIEFEFHESNKKKNKKIRPEYIEHNDETNDSTALFSLNHETSHL